MLCFFGWFCCTSIAWRWLTLLLKHGYGGLSACFPTPMFYSNKQCFMGAAAVLSSSRSVYEESCLVALVVALAAGVYTFPHVRAILYSKPHSR